MGRKEADESKLCSVDRVDVSVRFSRQLEAARSSELEPWCREAACLDRTLSSARGSTCKNSRGGVRWVVGLCYVDCCACHVHVVLGVMPIDEIVLGSVVVVRRNEDARLPEYP